MYHEKLEKKMYYPKKRKNENVSSEEKKKENVLSAKKKKWKCIIRQKEKATSWEISEPKKMFPSWTIQFWTRCPQNLLKTKKDYTQQSVKHSWNFLLLHPKTLTP